ncbi:VRR-NUC domain-containing protein [uncultured Thiomicrorhabdus sp.]
MAVKNGRLIYPSEHEEQKGFINWFRHKFPHLLIFAVPNGEKRAISVAKRLKAEGVLAGVPDLFILLPDGETLILEMKREKGGRLSPQQKDFISKSETLGHTVLIGYGAKDASEKVLSYLIHKKDRQP